MGFFSDIGKKTSEVTGKIAKETKLKIKINENKAKIEDIYEEIGKKVYEKHIREEKIDIKTDLEDECAKLDELSNEIENARLEILKLNQKKLCTKCSAEIEEDSKFCSKCGEKQNSNEPTIEQEALERLEESEIEPEKEQEANDVKEDLKEEIQNQE